MSAKPRVRVQAGDALGTSARPVAMMLPARSNYAAADRGSAPMAGWLPSNLSPDAAWLYERDLSIARLRDFERNEGWASSGVDRQVDMLVGGALRLNSKPDPLALGITQDEAHELGRTIQSAWRTWAEDTTFRCDAERQLPFAGLAGLVAREFVAIGESLQVMRWLPRPGWNYATAVQVISADRLSNPHGAAESEMLRGGVEKLPTTGEPIAYHFRRSHPGDLLMGASASAFQWERIPRWDLIGDYERPKVLHVYDKREPGQTRGVSKLVAGLLNGRLLSRYKTAEVNTAAINATVVGAIYTQLGPEYAAEMLGTDQSGGLNWTAFNDNRGKFYDERRVLDDARFLVGFPSDRVDFNTTPRQTAGFPAFQKSFLQAFAASLGISYEQLSMDWSSTNYSSARAALNEVWRGVMRLRQILIWGFALPTFACFLEEALDSGEVVAPAKARDFYEVPGAWLRAEWIGPGRGYVDPVKEAQAGDIRREGNVSTLEREAAEQGLDWEIVLEQIARENAELDRLKIARPVADTSVVPRTDIGNDTRANAA